MGPHQGFKHPANCWGLCGGGGRAAGGGPLVFAAWGVPRRRFLQGKEEAAGAMLTALSKE